jgi:hypothetical protein
MLKIHQILRICFLLKYVFAICAPYLNLVLRDTQTRQSVPLNGISTATLKAYHYNSIEGVLKV